MGNSVFTATLATFLAVSAGDGTGDLQRRALLAELKGLPHRIVFQSNRWGNWDIWMVNADGTGLRNLTRTPGMDEIYPKVSPDGRRLVFIGDRFVGKGSRRRLLRALYLMNIDGSGRKKIGDGLQNPCWSPDGKSIALVRSNRLNPSTEYYTRELMIYDLESGRLRYIRRGFFRGIFALTWSPDGKWFLFAQRGMKRFGYQLLLTDVEGRYVYPIKNYGCRPDFSPDGTRIAWNTSDREIAVGRIDLSALTPGRRRPVVLTDVRPAARVKRGKVYYVDFSPGGKYLLYARGHAARVGHSFRGTGRWRLWVTRSTELRTDRLPVAVPITSPPWGADDKEPDWVPGTPSGGKPTTMPARDRRNPVERALDDLGKHLRQEVGPSR